MPTDRISRRSRGLTVVAKQRELVEEPAPISSSVPVVPPLRLRKRIPSVGQLNGRNSSPSRPRASPVFDAFPSIESRLSKSMDGVAGSVNVGATALTRSQSLYVQPTTPKRRQSALIMQRIEALNAAVESTGPASDRSIRRSTSPLPILPTRA
jgi:hypothetical protein